jgi:hypothetical protein
MGFGLWAKIKNGFKKGIEWVKDKGHAVYDFLRDGTNRLRRKIGNTGGPFGDISEKLGNFGDKIKTGVGRIGRKVEHYGESGKWGKQTQELAGKDVVRTTNGGFKVGDVEYGTIW